MARIKAMSLDHIPKPDPLFFEEAPPSPLLQGETGTSFVITKDELVRITPERFAYLNENFLSEGYSQLIIIDARFDYEFRGGRIIGARNIRSLAELIGLYNRYKGENVCIVFYCEFSETRSPAMLRAFREYDREQNVHPNLSFPNLFLLDGGYKRFFSQYPQLCVGGYTKMRSKEYIVNGNLKIANREYQLQMNQTKTTTRRRSVLGSSPLLGSHNVCGIGTMLHLTTSASQGY